MALPRGLRAASTSVYVSALIAAVSVLERSSSFLLRNSIGRSNMRLLTVVSMLKTLRCLFVSRPIRVTLVASALFSGSM